MNSPLVYFADSGKEFLIDLDQVAYAAYSPAMADNDCSSLKIRLQGDGYTDKFHGDNADYLWSRLKARARISP